MILIGIFQGKRRLANDDGYISADAEILRIDSRTAVATINHFPIIANEYRPIISYYTETGEFICSELPYTMKISPEYQDYKKCFLYKVPLTIKYNPEKPRQCFYGSKRTFRIREIIYKMLVGALLIFIGYLLVWSHFHI